MHEECQEAGKTSEESPGDENLERLYELVQDIEIAMLTTRRPDGSLVTRPVATQRRAVGADFWFVTSGGAPKLEDIALDPNVNLAWIRRSGREWVSVSGQARISRDRSRIRELYEPSWKVWFPDEGGERDGGPDDPRIVLLAVEARSAHFTIAYRAPHVVFEHVQSLVALRPSPPGEITALSAGGTP